MAPQQKYRGPSRGIIAWRGFVVETVLCVVLIAEIVLRGSHDVLAAPSLAVMIAAVVRIVRRPSGR
jgi:hypothetical protein